MPLSRHLARPLAALTSAAVLGLGVIAPAAAVSAVPGPAPRLVSTGDILISEIHYDNDGADAGEAIEVQAPAGTDLTGWSLVLYNGNGGSSYATLPLTGTVAAGDADLGVLVVEHAGIQNGGPDGVALVDSSGMAVEFLSYEGTFTGVGGPADGIDSTDIGVSEPGSTPIGHSLQRIDGVWTGPAENSFGAVNTADGGGDPDPDPDPPAEDTHTIAQIQGPGDVSPVEGQTVTTSGVVTAAYPTGGFNGYYIQTPGTGGAIDPAELTASHGLFVYSSATVGDVAIGDYVRVTGEVTEYFGLTEITVDAGHMSILDVDAEPVEPIADFTLGVTDAERELVEGMLVTPVSDYVVSDTYALGGWGSAAYGTVGLGLDGPLLQETDVAPLGSAEYDAAVADNEARAVTLDDGQSAATSTSAEVPYLTGTPDLRTGVSVEFNEPVIVDYRYQWNFQPTAPVTGNADDLVSFAGGNTQAANATPAEVGGDLVLATFNVLNYFTTFGEDVPGCEAYTDREDNPLTVRRGCDPRGAWDETNFERQQAKIVAAINGLGADVVSLEEIENSVKFGDDRDASLAALVEALNADAGDDLWAYAASPSELPALADQDVIRNAFIYTPATVEVAGDSVVLTGDPAFDNAREPLAQVFTAAGTDYSFLAVTNHFKSKGGDCGDLPQGCFESDRVDQAESLTTFAEDVAAAAEVDDIFLLGDFNSYSAELPALAIEDAGYSNLNNGETTYVFDGKVGSLDHVYANGAAAERVTGVDIWSINSAESVLAEYSRYNYFASEHFQPGTQYRASDHDPILVGIDVPDVAPEPLGSLTDDLNRAADSTRVPGTNLGGESTLGNTVADAQVWVGQLLGHEPQIGLVSTSVLTADLANGDVYADDVLAAIPLEEVVVVEITGAQLRSVLEQQWSAGGERQQLSVSDGFTYLFDPSAPIGERIVAMTLDGEPIAEGETYSIVTSAALAAGGDGFSALAEGTSESTGALLPDAVAGYIAELKVVSPDYVQRSVGLTWVSDPTAIYAPGDQIAVDVFSFVFSTGEPVPDQLETSLGGVVTEPAALDATAVDGTDQIGRAEVRVTVPEVFGVTGGQGERQATGGSAVGVVDLVVTDPVNGTELVLEVQIGSAGSDGGSDGAGDGSGGHLPETGASNVWTLVFIALGLALAGGVVMIIRRKASGRS
ncbi:ExeM/NucH family extracellular endonuclease [Ruania alkalisoli]|uniref:ExeM/NucH family extracellular endonuclease n=1 Tax=Ruania alkalisoli TaxID=2779775 RepID=A0A7M1SRM4_9MICO|nr:ExeM/NucH family extracellular endonuclease [Ruania alkalisoli]QOR70220.1 ExeM/NucH family extracellular endonuclease [Ruania alkalisoli]